MSNDADGFEEFVIGENGHFIDALMRLTSEHGAGPIIDCFISYCSVRGERCSEAGDTRATSALFDAELDLERALSRLERANIAGSDSKRPSDNDNQAAEREE